MVIDTEVRFGGTWRSLTNVEVRLSGSWRDCDTVEVKSGGVWRQVFQKLTLGAGPGGTVDVLDGVSPYNSNVGIRFNTDGTVDTGESTNGGIIWTETGTWINPTSEADSTYDVRFTNLSQTQGSGDWNAEAAADDVWIAISSTRTWTANSTIVTVRRWTCDFEVRKNGGAPPTTGSASYTFGIENTT